MNHPLLPTEEARGTGPPTWLAPLGWTVAALLPVSMLFAMGDLVPRPGPRVLFVTVLWLWLLAWRKVQSSLIATSSQRFHAQLALLLLGSFNLVMTLVVATSTVKIADSLELPDGQRVIVTDRYVVGRVAMLGMFIDDADALRVQNSLYGLPALLTWHADQDLVTVRVGNVYHGAYRSLDGQLEVVTHNNDAEVRVLLANPRP